VLDQVDLSLSLTPEEYAARLKKAQAKLRELQHQIYLRRVPVVIAYEGWDAALGGLVFHWRSNRLRIGLWSSCLCCP
jgi:Polyphosphate kinase 2 (PPK2).